MHTNGFFTFLSCLVKERNGYKVIKYMLASLKTLFKSAEWSDSLSAYVFQLSFAASGPFFGTTFRLTGGYLRAGTRILKSVTARILNFSPQKKKPNIVNTICVYKSTDLFRTLKKYSSHDTIPLKKVRIPLSAIRFFYSQKFKQQRKVYLRSCIE
jgi:hypothetical protein